MIKAAFVLALLASGGATILAAGGNNSDHLQAALTLPEDPNAGKPESLYSWIQRNLHCPDFIQTDNEDNKVMLYVHVDKDGALQVTNASATDQRLVDYVRHQLNGKIFKTSEPDHDYHFAIRFRRIG